MSVTYRVLPPEEWARLEALPFGRNGLPGRDDMVVVVAEEDGAIVGLWSAMTAVHMEGLWVADRLRRTGVFDGINARMLETLKKLGIRNVFTLVAEPYVKEIALKRGFVDIGHEVLMQELPCQ
jgi:N-acetylglutamate synthase-like GNAT family acetyltransferase